MGHTFLFVTFLAAQSPQVIYGQGYPQSGCNCQQQQAVMMMPQDSGTMYGRTGAWTQSPMVERTERKPGLIGRIRDWFGRGDRNDSYRVDGGWGNQGNYYAGGGQQIMMNQHAAAPNQQPQQTTLQTREPELAGSSVSTVNFRPSQSGAAGQTTAARPSKIRPELLNSIGHEDDYSWITGQLDREGNRLVIRYATAETVDRFNGQIYLAPGIDTGNARPGDLVSVTGQVVSSGPAGATYRAVSIHVVPRD